MTSPSPSTTIAVTGNIAGSIVVGDHNFVVNTNHGTIVYKQAAPRVQLRSATPQPPRPPRDFVGRAKELAGLETAIAAHEVALVYGPEGMGKTALMKKAANGEAARSSPNGVVIVEGADERGEALGFDDVIQRLFDALYESEPPLKVNATTARTYLSNARPLVLLDNLNIPASRFGTLADLCPQGAMLISGLRSTVDEAVSPLKLEPLSRDESIELFMAKAGVALDEVSRGTLDAICELLADVPLAIVTAAGAVREARLSLSQAQKILTVAETVRGDRAQVGIKRAYVLSYSTLNDGERKVLNAVAAAPGLSLDPTCIQVMMDGASWADPAIEKLQALELLHANSPRLRIDPAFRTFARPKNPAPIYDKLIIYLADSLRGQYNPQFCADELGNILGAMAWTADQKRWRDVITLGQAIDPYFTLNGLWDAWKTVLDLVLRAARNRKDRIVEGWALHQLGTREIGVGLKDQAINFLQRALEIRRRLDDAKGIAHTQHNLDLLVPPALPPDGGVRPPAPRGGLPVALIAGGAILIVALILIAGLVAIPFLIPTPPTPTSTSTPTATILPSDTPTQILTATVTPSPPPDTTPPSIERVSISDKVVFYGCEPSKVTVAALVFDDVGILPGEVYIEYRYVTDRQTESQPFTAAMTYEDKNDDNSGQYAITIDVGNEAPNLMGGINGGIEYRLFALDTNKNVGEQKKVLPIRVEACIG